MRWHVLRTLLHKEALRHLANRGGIALILLLVVASMLLSFFGTGGGPGGGLDPGVRLCYVDYWEESDLVEHLRHNVPAELKRHLRFRPAHTVATDAAGRLVYPQGTAAIQLRPGATPDGAGLKVCFWHPGAGASALAPFEVWFWKESLRFCQSRAAWRPSALPAEAGPAPAPTIESERAELKGGFDPRSGLASALVLFALFFVCVYLLPALTCEERERGVLLAQMLSPASPAEILAAKFLFYPALAAALAAVLAGTYQPQALARPFFWLALGVAVQGSMGIGLAIASLARTQRTASMAAMGYTLAVALILFICQQNDIPGLPYLALEYHCPRMLHAALTDAVRWYHWAHLTGAAALAGAWTVLAAALFRRRGWQ
jgi:hypothetical protein